MNAPAKIVDLSCGHWSLLDVINYQAFGLVHWLDLLQQERSIFASKHMMLMQIVANPPPEDLSPEERQFQRDAVQVSDADRRRLGGFLTYGERLCEQLELSGTENRIVRFRQTLREPGIGIAPARLAQEIQTLHEALQDDLKFKGFYYYPDAKRVVLLRLDADWATALAALPALGSDLAGAVDCYAVGHNLACVFYLMRVMEAGVQRFGKRLGVASTKLSATKLKDLTWHEILNEMNPKLKALPLDTPARKARQEKFSAIQSYLYGVKDAWRNPTMHPRKEGYNDLETLDILNHVRSFMNELASALSSRSPP